MKASKLISPFILCGCLVPAANTEIFRGEILQDGCDLDIYRAYLQYEPSAGDTATEKWRQHGGLCMRISDAKWEAYKVRLLTSLDFEDARLDYVAEELNRIYPDEHLYVKGLAKEFRVNASFDMRDNNSKKIARILADTFKLRIFYSNNEQDIKLSL